jgi:uncharacterized protein YndB with AHSA1/START domain
MENLNIQESKDFVMSRTVKAPRQLVWEVYTQKEHLEKWFGPPGFIVKIPTMEFRPGGMMHYYMDVPNAGKMWGKWIFKEIVPIEKLVNIVSFSDEQAGYSRHPMAPTWPVETESTMLMEDMGDETKITIYWKAIHASKDECELFDNSHDNMNQGMSGTFAQLDTYLATLV